MKLCLSQSRGFTLLEILVAITLFSAALLLLYGGLYGAARSWESTERQVEFNENQRTQLVVLRKLINQAVPLILYDGRENRILFRGGKDYLRLVTPLPSHRGGDWAYLVTLQTRAGDTGNDLVLVYQDLRGEIDLESEPGEETADTLLIEAIDTVEFQYFGSQENGIEADWQAEWTSSENLPLLVRMELKRAEHQTPYPVQIIALHGQAVRGQLQQILYATGSPVPADETTDELSEAGK